MNNAAAAVMPKKRRASVTTEVLRRLAKDKVAMLGLIILIILVLASVFAPLLTPYSPTSTDFSSVYKGPSLQHLFGTDKLGRDILTRCLYGGRYSLSLGFLASLVSIVIGVVVGTMQFQRLIAGDRKNLLRIGKKKAGSCFTTQSIRPQKKLHQRQKKI